MDVGEAITVSVLVVSVATLVLSGMQFIRKKEYDYIHSLEFQISTNTLAISELRQQTTELTAKNLELAAENVRLMRQILANGSPKP